MKDKKFPYEGLALTPSQARKLEDIGYTNVRMKTHFVWREGCNIPLGWGLETTSKKERYIGDEPVPSITECLNLLPKAISKDGKSEKVRLGITKLDGNLWEISYGEYYRVSSPELMKCAYSTLLWLTSTDFQLTFIKRERA